MGLFKNKQKESASGASENDTVVMKKKTKKKFMTKRKWGVVFVIIFLCIVIYAITAFLKNNTNEGEALTACQALYSQKVDRFTSQTGLTHGNIVFNSPRVSKKRNLYIMDFMDIDLGNQKDRFLCYYNLTTHKATDRTPEPDFSKM